MFQKLMKLQEEVAITLNRTQTNALPDQREEGTAGTTFGLILDEKQGNSFKWTDEEHVRYVYFLELNRLKIKSKHIRKSNAFFRQMAAYIPSKTALKCRSHHQKYEERYKFPHRIISAQKKVINLEIYAKIVNEMNQAANSAHCIRCTRKASKKFVSVECQTDLPEPEQTNQAIWPQDSWQNPYQMHQMQGGYNPFPFYPRPYFMM